MTSTHDTPKVISGAEYVIGKFGGLAATARALGKRTSTVQGWHERKRIPQDYWDDLIAAAKQRDKLITYEDFLKSHRVPVAAMARAG